MLVTDRPSTCTGNSEQDFTATPSSSTVHPPHWLVSHPTCVPVRPSASRKKWTSSIRGSTSRVSATPFTWIVMELTAKPPFGRRADRPARRGSGVSTQQRSGQHAPRRGLPVSTLGIAGFWVETLLAGAVMADAGEPARLLDFERLHDPLSVFLRELEARLPGVLLISHAELRLFDGDALHVERLAPGGDLREPDQLCVAVAGGSVDDPVLAGG